MRKKRMMILFVAVAIVLLMSVWFAIPYSPVKNQFKEDVQTRTRAAEQDAPAHDSGVYTREDFARLPPLVRDYVEACGYIGTPRKSVLTMEYQKVAFALGQGKPKLTIDYTQVDFAAAPARLAFIDSRMFGIPFQGYDYYMDGRGGMKGVLAKLFQLFDQTGDQMDKACLATYLAEIIFLPEALLQDFVSFKQIDGHTLEARISFGGVSASGTFRFNDAHEMTCFSTDERSQTAPGGTAVQIPWEARCESYGLYSDGIKRPTLFRAVWKYPEKDFIYFDGSISSVDGAEVMR